MKKILQRSLFIFKVHRSIPVVFRFFTSRGISNRKKWLFVLAFILYAILPFNELPILGEADDVVALAFLVDLMRKQVSKIEGSCI